MFVLYLNDMRHKAETLMAVARADCQEDLEVFVRRETVESYRDGPWLKSYRKGGPLEWYNPPEPTMRFGPGILDEGTADDAAERARRAWEDQADRIPRVEGILGGFQ